MNFTLDEIKEYEEDDELTKTKLLAVYFSQAIYKKKAFRKFLFFNAN